MCTILIFAYKCLTLNSVGIWSRFWCMLFHLQWGITPRASITTTTEIILVWLELQHQTVQKSLSENSIIWDEFLHIRVFCFSPACLSLHRFCCVRYVNEDIFSSIDCSWINRTKNVIKLLLRHLMEHWNWEITNVFSQKIQLCFIQWDFFTFSI